MPSMLAGRYAIERELGSGGMATVYLARDTKHAYVYTGLGELDRAVDCLERACEQRSGAVYGIKGSFLFASLRSHPRFQALLKKMNLG